MRIVAHLHWERLFVYCFGYVEAPGIYWMIPSPARVSLINQVASRPDFDVVICEFEGNAELALDLVNIPKVLATHNVQSGLFRRIRQRYAASWEDRLFYWPELVKIIRYEKHNYSHFNLAITVSADDRDVLRRRCSTLPVAIIPNGVDVSFYHPSAVPVDPKSFVYVGNYSYPPNADAIRYFCREIFPPIRQRVPDAQLIAVGLEPPQEILNLEGVQATGFVPDIRPYMAQAGSVIVPLRVGGGTRLKILDAMAMGKPIVSTTVGAEGIEATHGEHILLADHPQEFADCVVRLIEQPELRAQLGKNGRKLAEQKYDWDILARLMDQSLQQVVSDFRTAQPDRQAVKRRLADAQS
jgi:glycosyltransferase involved in cell wall biosynthesis